jgi:uncharacterized protein YbjT (DUF2867 family)
MAIPLRLINPGVLLLLLTISLTNAFITSPLFASTTSRTGTQKTPTRELFQRQSHFLLHHLSSASKNTNTGDNDKAVDSESSRREFLDASVASSIAAILTASGAWSSSASSANAATASSVSAPICVIGANGKTGTMCVRTCLDRSIPVIATSRSGIFNNKIGADGVSEPLSDAQLQLCSVAVCDVTEPSTISAAISKSRAVIFAASASKEGGTAAAVDNEGLVNVAQACIAAGVPHLVIVSSGGVSKPDSVVYKFLNLFGNIMEQKIRGEDAVRTLYASSNSEGSSLTYTIVRPGGLTEESPVGVTGLELNQGDVVSGRISRADVASLCIESVQYPGLAGKTTYECYAGDTGKPLQSVGFSNIFKQTTSSDDANIFKSGKERRGDTWEKLFTGLDKDISLS